MYKIATLLFVAILARGCDSKIVVDHVDSGKSVPANGVIYSLPNTVAKLQVKVDKARATGAQYSPFAPIFAPDGDAVCKYETIDEATYTACIGGQDSYSLQQGAIISTFGEPDPTQVFLVRFVGNGRIDQSLSLTWNETGLLSSASSQVTNRTSDILLAGLKAVTGLGIKLALGAAKVTDDNKSACDSGPTEQDKWILPVLATTGNGGAPTLIQNYCSMKMSERRKFPQSGNTTAFTIKDGAAVVKTVSFKDLLQEAVNAYTNDVANLVKARLTILSDNGQSSTPAALLAPIEAEISKRLTDLYLGTKKTFTWEGVLNLRNLPQIQCAIGDAQAGCVDLNNPNKGLLVDVINIDESKGICLKTELSPESKPIPKSGPSTFQILNGAACDNATAIKMRLNFFPVSDSQLFTRITSVPGSEQSFRYRVPAQVQGVICTTTHSGGATVCDDSKKTYGSGVFSVAQLGKIIALPVTRHSKSLSYELGFIESTGALKSFKLNSTGGVDPATIDALSGVAGSIIEARQKGDEINKLTRLQQLLKLQDDICTIQKKYGLECTVQPQ